MDESSGRAMARNLKIRISGTLGVLLFRKIQFVRRPQTV
jgi:predicted nucleic acid-binding protein